MEDNNQNTSTQSSQQNTQVSQSENNSTAAANAGWVTVNTSSSVEAQRMNIMKGNRNEFDTKQER